MTTKPQLARQTSHSATGSSLMNDDEQDLDNNAIIDNVFLHTKLYSGEEVNNVIRRVNERVHRDAERSIAEMKKTLDMVESLYTKDKDDSEAETEPEKETPAQKVTLSPKLELPDLKDKSTMKQNSEGKKDSEETKESKLTKNKMKEKSKENDTKAEQSKAKEEEELKAAKESPKQENRRSVKLKPNAAKVSNRNSARQSNKPKVNSKTAAYIEASATNDLTNLDANDKSARYSRSPKTNLSLPTRSWSVSSYDSCGGDTRRHYASHLATTRRKQLKDSINKFAGTFLMFRSANNDSDVEIPKHIPEEWKDEQPFGPLEEDDPWYVELYHKNKQLHNKGNVLSATLSRISRKSFSTGLSPAKSFGNNNSGGINHAASSKNLVKSKGARVTLAMSKIFAQAKNNINNTLQKTAGRRSRSGTQNVVYDSVSEITQSHIDSKVSKTNNENNEMNKGRIVMNEFVTTSKMKKQQSTRSLKSMNSIKYTLEIPKKALQALNSKVKSKTLSNSNDTKDVATSNTEAEVTASEDNNTTKNDLNVASNIAVQTVATTESKRELRVSKTRPKSKTPQRLSEYMRMRKAEQLQKQLNNNVSPSNENKENEEFDIDLQEDDEDDPMLGRYVPPDMEWSEKANSGKGGFVNKVPKYIPSGKVWSRSANSGKGGLVNKQPPSVSIPPGKVWSRTAFNGQGGIVNLAPKNIQKGLKWDYDACEGRGGLVKIKADKNSKEKKNKNSYRVSVGRYESGRQMNNNGDNNNEEGKAINQKVSKKVKKTEDKVAEQEKATVEELEKAEVEANEAKEEKKEKKPKKSRKYFTKTIKGKKTPRSATDEEKQDFENLEETEENEENVEEQAENVEPEQNLEENEKVEEKEEGEEKVKELEEHADPEEFKKKHGELKSLEEKLLEKQSELEQRESIIAKRETEMKQKELELETKSTLLQFSTNSQNNTNANFDIKDNGTSIQPVFEEIDIDGNKVTHDFTFGDPETETVNPVPIKPLRKSKKAKNTDEVNNTRKRTNKKTLGSQAVHASPKNNRVSAKQATGKVNEFRTSFQRNPSKVSFTSNAKTSLMEEAGIEQGHVLKMFSRFERQPSREEEFEILEEISDV